jgi:DNA helicase HerA-like ATPase
LADAFIKLSLKTLNRHGLIAGVTGKRKTKTIQVFSEQLSLLGIPVLMMDIKGVFVIFSLLFFKNESLR